MYLLPFGLRFWKNFITLHMKVDIIPMRLGVFIRISVKISLSKGFLKLALDRMFDIWPKNPSMLSYEIRGKLEKDAKKNGHYD